MDLPASVANKRLTPQLSPLDATYKKHRWVRVLWLTRDSMMIPVLRASVSWGLCWEASALRGNNFFFPYLLTSLLRHFSPKPEPRSAPAAADADSASQCSSKCCRTASRCRSPLLPSRRCRPAPFRPCEFPAETL